MKTRNYPIKKKWLAALLNTSLVMMGDQLKPAETSRVSRDRSATGVNYDE